MNKKIIGLIIMIIIIYSSLSSPELTQFLISGYVKENINIM